MNFPKLCPSCGSPLFLSVKSHSELGLEPIPPLRWAIPRECHKCHTYIVFKLSRECNVAGFRGIHASVFA